MPVFSVTGRVQTPSEASIGRSRGGLPKAATIFVACASLDLEEVAPQNDLRGCVLHCCIR